MTLTLDGVSGQRHVWSRFTLGERTPSTHWTGDWVGPRAGLDTEARGKIICPCRGSNLDGPLVDRHCTVRATPAPRLSKYEAEMPSTQSQLEFMCICASHKILNRSVTVQILSFYCIASVTGTSSPKSNPRRPRREG
jgi:hypothetical protein